ACSSASVISNWLSVDGAVHSGSFAGILILSVAKNFRYDGAIAAILHPSFCLVVATGLDIQPADITCCVSDYVLAHPSHHASESLEAGFETTGYSVGRPPVPA